jgi:putative DNA primase/helicase
MSAQDDISPRQRLIIDAVEATPDFKEARVRPQYPAPRKQWFIDIETACALSKFGAAAEAWGKPRVIEPAIDFNQETFPVTALRLGAGLGKTMLWRNWVTEFHTANPSYTAVLAIPTHVLGDEIKAALAKQGISAEVYRGYGAPDPEADGGSKMCLEILRENKLSQALGSVKSQACKKGAAECASYRSCGYQQQRQRRPRVWLIPHNLLFRERPDFIPKPDSIAIDESFWGASLNGLGASIKNPDRQKDYVVWIDELQKMREITKKSQLGGVRIDHTATADLLAISQRIIRILSEEMGGRIRRAALAGIAEEDLQLAYKLEWRRKTEPDVEPGMPLPLVAERCDAVADNNQMARKLAQFWQLLLRTLKAPGERSAWLTLIKAMPVPKGGHTAPAIVMGWSDDIHESWHAPILIMDATSSTGILKRFFPQARAPMWCDPEMPHTRVTQIIDRTMSKNMLVPGKYARARTQRAALNNVQRVRRIIEVHGRETAPGRMLVITYVELEALLAGTGLPPNVELAHFGNVAGRNDWGGVATLMIIGRQEPTAWEVECSARSLFGADIPEMAVGKGGLRYPHVQRGVRMRDDRGVGVMNTYHPDPLAERVRWQICEAGLIQAYGRGRGGNRTADNPLRIILLTNVVLPLEVDELTTWKAVWPTFARVMWARGAVPLNYADMAMAYPDLFESRDAAQKTLIREKPRTNVYNIESYFIDVCPGFLELAYRRAGSRGPAGRLLYDPEIIKDPAAWLAEKLGDARVIG